MPQTEFWCVPECKSCKDANSCPNSGKLQAIRKKESRKKPDPHAGNVILPCGHWGLPWGIVKYLGQNLEEIYCDKCGWVKVTAAWKKRAAKEADNLERDLRQPKLATDNADPPF